MTAVPPSGEAAAPASSTKPRGVLSAISGLVIGMFVAIIASTVVSTSLPRIVTDLGGDQSTFTWVVTASLLAMTVTTPIWGKLADLLNRKLLVQLALVIFVAGTAAAGFAQDPGQLIGFRVVQGLGIGGLMALVQIVIADLISPRERGKYMGLIGAVMGVGTVGGPLVGGLITDAFGWRWNFFIGLPIAVVAIIMIQRTLHLPKRPARPVRIDYAGAVLIAAGVSTLLIWVSLAGNQFDWWSTETVVMVGGSLLALIAAVIVELKVAEPIIPMHLFRDRTFSLSVIASISVGVAMFGTSVFLSQYMQLARGATPTESGLMTLPMIIGQLGGSIVVGQLISRFGKWKGYMVVGSVLAIIGLSLMGTLHYDTDFTLVSIYMFVLGLGVGLVMQNLVLVVQNSVHPRDMGAASSGVAFFRSLGGTVGVSAMGAVLGSRVAELIKDGLGALQPEQLAGAEALSSGALPSLAELPEPIRLVVEASYGSGVAEVFLLAVPLAVISLIAIAFLPNKPLSRQTSAERLAEEAADAAIELAEAETGSDALVLTGPVRQVRAEDAGDFAGDDWFAEPAKPGAAGSERGPRREQPADGDAQ